MIPSSLKIFALFFTIAISTFTKKVDLVKEKFETAISELKNSFNAGLPLSPHLKAVAEATAHLRSEYIPLMVFEMMIAKHVGKKDLLLILIIRQIFKHPTQMEELKFVFEKKNYLHNEKAFESLLFLSASLVSRGWDDFMAIG
jgi:hypothetical protein